MSKLEKLKSGQLEIDSRKNGKIVINGELIEKGNKKFFKIKAKKQYLDNKNPFAPLNLTDKKICFHCGKEIVVGDYQISIDNHGNSVRDLIACPNAPECDGTIIDWYDVNERNKTRFGIK